MNIARSCFFFNIHRLGICNIFPIVIEVLFFINAKYFLFNDVKYLFEQVT
jgi:hypothetical protein